MPTKYKVIAIVVLTILGVSLSAFLVFTMSGTVTGIVGLFLILLTILGATVRILFSGEKRNGHKQK